MDTVQYTIANSTAGNCQFLSNWLVTRVIQARLFPKDLQKANFKTAQAVLHGG